MAANRQQTSRVVLHVRPIRAFDNRDENAGEQIDNQLQQANLNVELCTDVYRALARLGKDSIFDNGVDQRYQAVLVCVDGLPPTEFEFFTVIAKHARKTPVFIYSTMDGVDQLSAASAAGATGIFNNDTIAMFINDNFVEPANSMLQSPKPDSANQASVSQPSLVPEITPETSESPILTFHVNESDEADSDTPIVEDFEEEQSLPVQVPWQTQRESPARVPPSRSEDDVVVASNEASPTPKEDANAPLLTEDELRALLDEDVASWPPSDWSEPDAANPNSGAELS